MNFWPSKSQETYSCCKVQRYWVCFPDPFRSPSLHIWLSNLTGCALWAPGNKNKNTTTFYLFLCCGFPRLLPRCLLPPQSWSLCPCARRSSSARHGYGHVKQDRPTEAEPEQGHALTGQAKLKGITIRFFSLFRLYFKLKVFPPMTGVDLDPKLQGPPAVTRDWYSFRQTLK